jgi:GTP-dependent dephospho-CoA kinase
MYSGERIFRVPENIRADLKTPLGELIPDEKISHASILSKISRSGSEQKLVVSVGDRSTERLQEYAIPHNLEIIDHVEKRNRRGLIPFSGNLKLSGHNEAGTISSQALALLSKSLNLIQEDSDALVRIEIMGEEDLLTLPVIAFFPPETVVAYGQPNEGIVIVMARGEPRKKSWDILAGIGIRSL